MNIALAQINPSSDDWSRNLEQHRDALAVAEAASAEVVVFPELSLSGYLVDDPAAWAASHLEAAIDGIRQAVGTMTAVVGAPWPLDSGRATNSALVITAEGVRERQAKIYLPDYGVYTEGRRFARGEQVAAFALRGEPAAILICEDAWHPALGYSARVAGARIMLHPAASPQSGVSAQFSSEHAWRTINRAQALYHGCHVLFVNHAGADRDTTFWGGSGLIGPDGVDIATLGTGPEVRVVDVDAAFTSSTRALLRMAEDEDPALALAELGRAMPSTANGR
jgi:predicted amidohydrolase